MNNTKLTDKELIALGGRVTRQKIYANVAALLFQVDGPTLEKILKIIDETPVQFDNTRE